MGHVEAGLRTGTIWSPWPEEANRRVVDVLASLHFAPTATAAAHLAREGHTEQVHVTGNTGIDALRLACHRLDVSPDRYQQPADRPTLLVTLHRRETMGAGHLAVLEAVRTIANAGVRVLFPVHPNPGVRAPVFQALDGLANVELTAPLDYLDFVSLMRAADLILTDSGGVQEEGPALGKPVLVARDVTERPEVVACGAALLVGTDADVIVRAILGLCRFGTDYHAMASAGSPYGDGHASGRIVAACMAYLGGTRPTADKKSDGHEPDVSAASSIANSARSHASPSSPL